MPDMPENAKFAHLGLRDWPFQIVPDERFYRIWAGRPQAKQTIEKLLFRWTRYDPSTIHLFWADFGAGKTHSLHHLRTLAEDRKLPVLCLYAALPKTLKSFVDLYRQVFANARVECFAPEFAHLWQTHGAAQLRSLLSPGLPDFVAAMRAICSEEPERASLGVAWLRADPNVGKRDLKPAGITAPLKTTDEAIAAWTAFVKAVAMTRRFRRVAILIDEYQRTGACRPPARQELCAALRSVFNHCPTNMSLVLSFSLGRPDQVKYLLSPELRSVVDNRDRLELPAFSREEAAPGGIPTSGRWRQLRAIRPGSRGCRHRLRNRQWRLAAAAADDGL